MSNHKARQISKIVEATLGIIHEKGISGLSFSAIAKAAGITRQTIYNYFPDLSSIIAKALEVHNHDMEAHLLEIINSAPNGVEKLRAFAQIQISQATPNHDSIPLEAGLPANVRQQLESQTHSIKSILLQAIIFINQTSNSSEAFNSELTCELLWALVNGAAKVAANNPADKQYILGKTLEAIDALLKY